MTAGAATLNNNSNASNRQTPVANRHVHDAPDNKVSNHSHEHHDHPHVHDHHHAHELMHSNAQLPSHNGLSKKEVVDSVDDFSSKMFFIALSELATGAFGYIATKGQSGFGNYILDSFVEVFNTLILGVKKIPKFIEDNVLPIADMLANKNEDAHRSHGHSHGPANHDHCCDEELDEKKEKLSALLSIVSAGVGFAYSQLKSYYSPHKEEEDPDNLATWMAKIGLPIIQVFPMLGAGIVKATAGDAVGYQAALQQAREDYICSGQSLSLAFGSILNKVDPRISKYTEYILGTGFSIASLLNAGNGLGWNFGLSSWLNFLTSFDLDSFTNREEGEKKYELSSIEKAAGKVLYNPIKSIANSFGCKLPDKESLSQVEPMRIGPRNYMTAA